MFPPGILRAKPPQWGLSPANTTCYCLQFGKHSAMMRGAKYRTGRVRIILAWCVMVFVIGGFWGGCTTPKIQRTAGEFDEAMFLYRFSQFVEWPPYVFPDPKSPMVIGVLGSQSFANELDNIVRNKNINGRPLVVRQVTSLSNLNQCWILFISRFDKSRLPLIFDALHGGHTLTVSDRDGFLEAGGMIQFVTEDNRPRFEVNQTATEMAGLKMSSQMLEMAKWPK